jgi:hypothetical protein
MTAAPLAPVATLLAATLTLITRVPLLRLVTRAGATIKTSQWQPQAHEVLIDYFLIIAAILCSIICLIVMRTAIESNLTLFFGTFSAIVLILYIQLCILTGVVPGTGLNGQYIIADVIAVAMIILLFFIACFSEG